MAIDKFYILYTGNTKGMGIEVQPRDASYTDVISTESDSSYIYFYGGDEYAPTTMTIDYYYDAKAIANYVGTNTIKKCKFNIRANSLHTGNYVAYIKITYKGVQIIRAVPNNTTQTYSIELDKNPTTNAPWVLSDFQGPFYLEMYTAAPGQLSLISTSMEIDHGVDHEVFNTPLGYIKLKANSSILQIPYFNTSLIAYPALRIRSSKGVGAFSLVNTTDPYASPIRVSTPKGIKAVAYQK